MECPHCKTQGADSARFCLKCGAQTPRLYRESRQACGPVAIGRPEMKDGPNLSGSGADDIPYTPPCACTVPQHGEYIAGRWELLEARSSAGMGVVYRARDHLLGGTLAAVRIMDEAREEDRRDLESLFLKAETVKGLNHRAIVRVHDVGAELGRNYIAMEWVEGEDLGRRIEREISIPMKALLPLLRQVFEGLSYAHRHSVVHGDIKPSKILITRDGVAKIVDFGLAPMAIETELSRTGYGPGTLAYMPPEQRSDAKRADHRSDIYALGKTIYHLLTGRFPDRFDPDALPYYAREVVGRALEPEPGDRWSSVDEFLEGLEACVQAGRRSGSLDVRLWMFLSRCATCGRMSEASADFCDSCGVKLRECCPACKAQISPECSFCPFCGFNVLAWRRHLCHLRSASRLLDAGDYAGAKREAELALEIRPEDPDATAIVAEAGRRENLFTRPSVSPKPRPDPSA